MPDKKIKDIQNAENKWADASVPILLFKNAPKACSNNNTPADGKKSQSSLFSDGDSKPSSTLELHRENFHDVLKQSKDRPVSIVCLLSGIDSQPETYRQNLQSSFSTLNYTVRYLSVLERAKDGQLQWDWMVSTMEEAAPGSYSNLWENEAGIFVWPKVFHIQDSNDHQVAVILVHARCPGATDGAENVDLTWKRRTILNLSLLLSSSIVVNLQRELKDDTLVLFEDFTRFADILLKYSKRFFWAKSSNVIQRLQFVLHDLNKLPTNGTEFLKERLNSAILHVQAVNPSTSFNFHQLSSFCNDLFLSCLPPTAHPSTTSPNSNLHPRFEVEMERFLACLIDPSRLHLKEIFGNVMTAEDLLEYFEEFAQLFNSQKSPSPNLLAETIKKLGNNLVVEKCLRIHCKVINILVLRRSFFNEKELQDVFNKARERSSSTFNNKFIIGSISNVEISRGRLSEKIDEYEGNIRQENQSRKQQILKRALNFIINRLEKQIKEKGETFLKNDCFEQHLLEDWTKLRKNEVVEEFFDIIGESSSTSITDPEIEPSPEFKIEFLEITLATASKLHQVLEENTEAQEKSRKFLSQKVESLVKSHKDAVDPKIENRYTEENQLTQLHATGHGDCLKEFEYQVSNFCYYLEYVIILEEKLKGQLASWREQTEELNHKRRRCIQEESDKIVENHRKILLGANLGDTTALKQLHDKLMPKFKTMVLRTITTALNLDSGDSTKETVALGERYLTEFVDSMTKNYEKLSSQVDRVKELLKDIDRRSEEYFSQYKKSMAVFWADNSTCSTYTLLDYHTKKLDYFKWLMVEDLDAYVQSLDGFEGGRKPPELNAQVKKRSELLIALGNTTIQPLIKESDEHHINTAHQHQYRRPFQDAIQTIENEKTFTNREKELRYNAERYMRSQRGRIPVPQHVFSALNQLLGSTLLDMRKQWQGIQRRKWATNLREFGLRKFIQNNYHSLCEQTRNTLQLAAAFRINPHEIEQIMHPADKFTRNKDMYGFIWSLDIGQNDESLQEWCEFLHDALMKTGNENVITFVRNELKPSTLKAVVNGAVSFFTGSAKNDNAVQSSGANKLSHAVSHENSHGAHGTTETAEDQKDTDIKETNEVEEN